MVQTNSQYVGYVDGIRDASLVGWCMSRQAPEEAVTVHIFEDSIYLGEAVAEIFRADLIPFGRAGCHGFSFPIPPVLLDGELHQLSVAVGTAGEILAGSPRECRLVPLDKSYDGELEGVERVHVVGWARNWQRPGEDPVITLMADGIPVATHKAFALDGAAERRFRIPLPGSLLDGQEHLLTALVGAEQIELRGSPLRFRLEAMLDRVDVRVLQEELTRHSEEIAGFRHQLLGLFAQAKDAVHPVPFGNADMLTAGLDLAIAQLEDTAAEVGLLSRLVLSQASHGLLTEVRRRFPPLDFECRDRPVLSVIVLACDQFHYTYSCLESLRRHPAAVPAEVILVDDGSSDETVLAPLLFAGIKVIRSEGCLGFIESCRRGAAAARGEMLMFIRQDIILRAGAIDELLAVFEDKAVGLAGPKLLFPNGQLQEAGGLIRGGSERQPLGRGEDALKAEYNYCRSVDYCSSAAFMVSRGAWDEVDGVDTAMRPGREDAELSSKLRAAGYDVRYQPFAQFVLFGVGSSVGTPSAGISAREAIPARKIVARSRAGRALFIDARTPATDEDAGSTVIFEQMLVLQSLGYDITFLPEDCAYVRNHTAALQRLGIEVIYAPSYTRVDSFLQDRGGEFALVYVHRFGVAFTSINSIRKHAPRARILFNPADLHFLRLSREAELSGDPAKTAQAGDTRERELAVIEAVDCTILCNTVEMEIVRKSIPNAFVHYLPWVISSAAQPGVPFENREGFMFLGGFGHGPNLDAVQYFIREVMPHCRKLLPGVPFYIYGSHMPEEVRSLEAPDVIACGYVPDLGSVFDKHRISVAPLRFGAGFKGKVAASLAHGVPVVGTPIAVEGTGLKDGQQVVVASDASEFAEAIAAVYNDRRLWERLCRQGRKFVLEHWSPEVARSHFLEIIAGLNRVPAKPRQKAKSAVRRRPKRSGR